MTDPRIIAVPSNPGQVEPGPFSEHDLREQWNAQADELNQWESLDSSEQLAWAQTRAIAADRFLPPVAKPTPVDLAALHDPNFSDGLTPGQHLQVLWGGPDPRVATTPAPEEPETERVLRLAEIIREADPADRIGGWAHQLAQALLKHPGFSDCHDGPAALPAQEAGEGLSDQEIIDLADFDAGFDRYDTKDESGNEGVAWECSNSQLLHFARLVRQGRPADLPSPGFQIGPQEYIPDFGPASAAQGEVEGSPIPEHKVKPSSFSIWNGPKTIIRDSLGRKLDNVLYCDPKTGEVISYVTLDSKGRLRGDRHEIMPFRMGDLLQQREFYPAPLTIEIEPATNDHA